MPVGELAGRTISFIYELHFRILCIYALLHLGGLLPENPSRLDFIQAKQHLMTLNLGEAGVLCVLVQEFVWSSNQIAGRSKAESLSIDQKFFRLFDAACNLSLSLAVVYDWLVGQILAVFACEVLRRLLQFFYYGVLLGQERYVGLYFSAP